MFQGTSIGIGGGAAAAAGGAIGLAVNAFIGWQDDPKQKVVRDYPGKLDCSLSLTGSAGLSAGFGGEAGAGITFSANTAPSDVAGIGFHIDAKFAASAGGKVTFNWAWKDTYLHF